MINAAIAGLAAIGLVVITTLPEGVEARVLLLMMTVLAWAFVAVYSRQPWRQTQAGRSVMATTVALGLIGTQLASVWWFGDYPGRAEIRSLVLLALVLTLLHRLLVLLKILFEERDDELSDR